MDKLANQLKADAALIETEISDELDRRIAASLYGVEPLQPMTAEPRQRSASFWWASSLTGVAAAFAVIAVLNSGSPTAPAPLPVAQNSPVNEAITPIIDWKTESAMLTRPLQREFQDLRSDLKKAEEKVKREIGF